MSQVISGLDPATGKPHTIEFEAGRIIAISAGEGDSDAYLTAGLIDLQVNGYAGIDLNAGVPSTKDISKLVHTLHGIGVTSFLPTLITTSRPEFLGRLTALSEAIETDPVCAEAVAGIHIEGPYIAPEDGPRGAHPREHVRAPDLDEFFGWQTAAKGRISIVTLSPHWDGIPEFIREASARGVHVALGHTGASAEQVHAAVAAGATLSTHLGNGAAAILPRHPNFIWAQLADDRLTACFIADGHHLPADTLKSMVRAKGLDRAILVSDTAALGGRAAGIYDSPIGGKVEVTADGRLGIYGEPYLAGAWRNLNQDVALMTRMTDFALPEVLKMATLNPGRFAGGRGRVVVGARADLMRFEFADGGDQLNVSDVWANGKRVAG